MMYTGQQPCTNFTPGAFSEYNYHECPGCPATRRFCESCNRDHHSGGWESCKAPHRQPPTPTAATAAGPSKEKADE